MQLSFTDYEVRIIRQKIRGDIMTGGILEKLESAEEEQNQRNHCKHQFGKYKGEKTCCVLCEGLDVGMGEHWTLQEKEK